MNLTSIALYSNNALVANLSLSNPSPTDPFLFTGSDGLDAEDIATRFFGFSTSSKKFYTLSLGRRIVTLKLSLNPNYNLNLGFSELRDTLYRAIYSSRYGKVELKFMNNSTVVAVLEGFVSRFISSRFTKDQDVEITLTCDDGWLKAPTYTSHPVQNLNNTFTVTDSISTAPHGAVFSLAIQNQAAWLTFKDKMINPEWQFRIEPYLPFQVGDVLYMSSEPDNKYIFIDPLGAWEGLGITTNRIYLSDRITADSIWPVIFPGDNSFTIETSGTTNVSWTSLQYKNTYWGI